VTDSRARKRRSLRACLAHLTHTPMRFPLNQAAVSEPCLGLKSAATSAKLQQCSLSSAHEETGDVGLFSRAARRPSKA
jgi:hypothetical protein